MNHADFAHVCDLEEWSCYRLCFICTHKFPWLDISVLWRNLINRMCVNIIFIWNCHDLINHYRKWVSNTWGGDVIRKAKNKNCCSSHIFFPDPIHFRHIVNTFNNELICLSFKLHFLSHSLYLTPNIDFNFFSNSKIC